MPKYFPGVTHSIVRTVHCAEDMKLMKGVLAFVDVCFGPGDCDAVRMIAIKKMSGPIAGVTAHIPRTILIREGKKGWIPVIEGKAAEEAKMTALIAFDRVKSAHGLKFNKTYRILAKTVEEIGVLETK